MADGGGEVARYVARYGKEAGVAKAVLIGAVPPQMLKTATNPGGLPIDVFDGIRKGDPEEASRALRAHISMAFETRLRLDAASGRKDRP